MQLVTANGVHLGPVRTLQAVLRTGGAKALLVGTVPRVSVSLCLSYIWQSSGCTKYL